MADKLDWTTVNSILSDLWDGPLENFRFRKFSQEDFDELTQKLSIIDVRAEATLDKTFVSLIWFMPQFMEWQQAGAREVMESSQTYANLCNWVNDRVMQILGGP